MSVGQSQSVRVGDEEDWRTSRTLGHYNHGPNIVVLTEMNTP